MKRYYTVENDTLHLHGDTFQLRSQLKELGAIWRPQSRCWVLRNTPTAPEKLLALGFLSDGSPQDTLVAESSPPTTVPFHAPEVSVEELILFCQRVLQQSLPEVFWVVGEVHGLRIVRGHWFFDLCQGVSPPILDSASPQLIKPQSLNAVLWAGKAQQLLQQQSLGADLAPIKEGLQVRLKGHLELRKDKGAHLQLVVEDWDLAYTTGKLALERLRTVAELKKRGLYDLNRSLRLSPLPLKIALITAPDSRAYSDFLHELGWQSQQKAYGFSVDFFPALMQGTQTSEEVVEALQQVALRGDYDVVVITRGGGSRLDLRWFDDFSIAKAIAHCPFPVMTAIGHFEDQSVADEVAFLAEKTPTGAARFIVQRLDKSWRELLDRTNRLGIQVDRILRQQHQSLESFQERLGGAALRCLLREQERLGLIHQNLQTFQRHLDRWFAQGVCLLYTPTGAGPSERIRPLWLTQQPMPCSLELEVRWAQGSQRYQAIVQNHVHNSVETSS